MLEMTRRIVQLICLFLASFVPFSKFSWHVVVEAWELPPPPQSNPTRRHAVQRMILSGGGSIFFATTNTPQIASATEEDDFVAFQVSPFSFEIPKSWKVIVKPNNNDNNNRKPTSPKDGKLFSAIDLGTGAVLTVVQEQICSREDYALNEKKQCDLVMAGEIPPFSSESTFSKDISKLLRRYDDRDNAALQGITDLDRVSEGGSSDSDNKTSWNLMATTSIPTGGTYTDRMGLEQPYKITRTVQSQVRVVGNENKILSLWLSAPSDEWRKPLIGARLLQVWASVK